MNLFEESLRNDREVVDGRDIPLQEFFERMRRGIGRGYAFLNDHNLGSKRAINALKRKDAEVLESCKQEMLQCWRGLQDICVTDVKYIEFSSKAGQELIEFLAVEALWLYVTGEASEPGEIPSAAELNMRPQTRLHGLGDVPGELGKMTIDLLLDDTISREEGIAIRCRLVGVVEMILKYLCEYENTYGLVIDDSGGRTSYWTTFRGIVQRVEELLYKMKSELLETKKRHELMSLLETRAEECRRDTEERGELMDLVGELLKKNQEEK
ncbi:MAG: hypothetical protein HZA36_00980 [Parcubacteria group bacterium]|nr:hypothetical protein [Parcubacteria group bacterium]